MASFPDPDQFEEPLASAPARNNGLPWGMFDLVLFAAFFAATVVLLPLGIIWLWQIFDPELTVTDLTGVQQVFLQGVMNFVLVGFIVFWVRTVHRQPFWATMHWRRDHPFGTGFLIALGAAMALTVLSVSSYFPPAEPPPIERLITSPGALYVFALFGIGVAPIVEEIIFRGFLFKIFEAMGGRALAVALTATLFTLLHVPQLWGSWAGIALILVVGFVLSAVRARANSLIPPFVIHTAYNAMLFGVFALSSLVQDIAPAN